MAAAQHAKGNHKVKAALVIAKKPDGSDLYLYHGAVLPDHITDEARQQFLDKDLVEEVSAEEAADSQPTSESN
jgi:hypothetical protein